MKQDKRIAAAFRRDLVIERSRKPTNLSNLGFTPRSIAQAFGYERHLTIEQQQDQGMPPLFAWIVALALAAVLGFLIAARG